MGYELRTQVIAPKRHTFDNLIERFGDRPASRYQEASFDLQSKEHFQYRPTWDTTRDLYDADYTALKLADPYRFTDPRQYYYAPYVASAAHRYDSFAGTLKYIEDRRLLDRLPEAWHAGLSGVVVPLRHYEQGAQLITTNATRFAFGSTVAQCMTYASFDRIGNAQLFTMTGLALAGGATDTLTEAKKNWLFAPSLQGIRRLVEEALVEPDWAAGILALELVDAQLYPMLFTHLDERALFRGAVAYSLVARHLNDWYADQKKWLVALLKAWTTDPEYGDSNCQALGRMAARWYPQATEAVRMVAQGLAEVGSTTVIAACERGAAEAASDLSNLGIPVPTGR